MRDSQNSKNTAEIREERLQQLQAAIAVRNNEDIEPLRVAIEAAEEVGLEREDIDPAVQLLRKLEIEQQPLTFTDVSRHDVEMLQAASSQDEAVRVLMRCMHISLDNGFQSEILAEFHYHNFTFCRRSKFCSEKTSTFLSIMNVLHTRAIVEDKLTELQARELFESLIEKHSWQLPPYKVGVFSQEEAMAVREYVNKSFLRHYSMYAYMYIKQEELSVHAFYESIVTRLPNATELHRSFEVDPQNVPELMDMFHDPGAEVDTVATAAAIAPASAGSAACGRGPIESPKEHEAAVFSAHEKAEQNLLGHVNPKLSLPN